MELLAPAGHWEAMVAAVQSGADSVYMGCSGFNARRGAKNFTPEEFAAAVKVSADNGWDMTFWTTDESGLPIPVTLAEAQA